MIHVDRWLVSEPTILRSRRADHARAEAKEFSYSGLDRSQRPFDFSRYTRWLMPEIRDPLLMLFSRKCAFCETRITGDTGTFDFEWFRPRAGAVGLDGERAPDHYWWLAFEWYNLYLACPACNRTKGSRFPVRGERARFEAGPGLLQDEAALLLDPCFDQPELHLVFSDDDTVAAVPFDVLPAYEQDHFGTPTRGQVTIDTFGLNRPGLVNERREQTGLFLRVLARVLPDGWTPTVKEMTDSLLQPEEPFLGMKRQLYERWLRDPTRSGGLVRESLSRTVALSLFSTLPSTDASLLERAVTEQKAHEQQILSASIEVDDHAATYRARTAYIERVELSGVTVFDDLCFSVLEPSISSGGDAPWLMLLGENGTGKTSILRAIALCLAGSRRLGELQDEEPPSRFLELFREGGSARVFLSSQPEPLEVRRVGGRLEATGEAAAATDQAKVFLRAFGPSRWFPAAGSQAPEVDPFVRIGNLFNHFVPLDPGEVALAKLAESDTKKWNDVASALKRLLLLPDDGISPPSRDGTIFFQIVPGNPTPLRALSAGYEAVVAIAGELSHLLYRRWGSLLDAEGICLLDEIDAHLHPRWKMRIVDSLRRTFPRVQFIATTHEPLCLRGLRAGEILVLRREAAPEGGGERGTVISALRPAEDVAALRIDQLLTSRLFGLHSTLDLELEKEFDRYYWLLSRHEGSLNEDERAELEELRTTVGSRGVLGSTRRDQLIYQIIDRFVAREPAMTDETQRGAEERWTTQQVEEAWAKIPDLPEDPA